MYVQYQIPEGGDKHLPVVMVHGCCPQREELLKPHRMGENGMERIFSAQGRAAYLPDQVSRARSGFDRRCHEIRLGKRPAAEMPAIRPLATNCLDVITASGPRWAHRLRMSNFPWSLSRNLEKQCDSRSECRAGRGQSDVDELVGARDQVAGRCIDGHSESGFFPERTALVNPANLEGLITIETECPTTLTPAQISTLTGFQSYGFRRSPGDVPGHADLWPARFKTCQQVVDQVNAAGGDAIMMHLPKYGQFGNSHNADAGQK